jgi:hypothetical protein
MRKNNTCAATLGHALRHQLFNKITPILISSDLIGHDATRELIRSNCFAMVSLIEQLISQFDLDQEANVSDQV